MKFRVTLAVLMLLLVGGVFATAKGTIAKSRLAPSAAAPHLTIDAKEHSFGSVTPGTPLRHAFVVKNDGDAVLEIQQVNPSCGCTTSSFDKTIAPGKSGSINLAIENTQTYQGEITKTATVVTNDPKSTNFTLTLRANFVK